VKQSTFPHHDLKTTIEKHKLGGKGKMAAMRLSVISDSTTCQRGIDLGASVADKAVNNPSIRPCRMAE
jgi:hypothetical protein